MPQPPRRNYFTSRFKLPVYQQKSEFLKLLRRNQCVILIGETGSGKTTQVPQWCAEYLNRNQPGNAKDPLKVVCTQPRRVAAINVARRVADEMNVTLGREVGYSVRFDERTSRDTLLKFATDGILLREIMSKRLFEPYGIVILDEAHERTLSTDILLGLLKEAMTKRPDLKIVVMSATVNTEQFQNYFTGCPVLRIPGRLFPVEIYYTEKSSDDYVKLAVSSIVHIHENEGEGDILVFLTGEEEIESACAEIRTQTAGLRSANVLSVLPLYSNLPFVDQQRIFKPSTTGRKTFIRKCIVSTNVAETSLTIEGIRFVIDAGFCKRKCFSPQSRIEFFQISPISKASANQRSGRAGRTAPGTCYRLYTEEAYNEMAEYTQPEITMCNLAALVLQLKRIGVENLVTFDYMTPPYPSSMIRALDLLYDLGAIDGEGELTEDGLIMAELPVDPQLAKMLIMSSRKYNCADEILTLVSLLSVAPVFVRPVAQKDNADRAREAFIHPDGDHLTLINVFNEFMRNGEKFFWCRNNYLRFQSLSQATSVKIQLEQSMRRFNLVCNSLSSTDPIYSESIRKCVLEGSFTQVVAQYGMPGKSTYICLKDGITKISIFPLSGHANSPPPWLVYCEFIHTYKKFVRTVSPIDPQWLLEIAPHYFSPEELEDNYFIKVLKKNKKNGEETNDQPHKHYQGFRELINPSNEELAESIAEGIQSISMD